MRTTILGFSQEEALEKNLSLRDLLILNYIKIFSESKNSKKYKIDGKDYTWIKYEKLLEDLQILKINKQTLGLCIKELVKKGLLDLKVYHNKGTYTVIRCISSDEVTEMSHTSNENELPRVTEMSYTPNENELPRVTETSYTPNENELPKDNILNKKLEYNILNKKTHTHTHENKSIIEKIKSENVQKCVENFINNRKKMNCPMSKKAIEIFVTKINKLSNTESEILAFIDKSIINNWKDIYPNSKYFKEKIEENNNKCDYKDSW